LVILTAVLGPCYGTWDSRLRQAASRGIALRVRRHLSRLQKRMR
jgi:hypothetical protein